MQARPDVEGRHTQILADTRQQLFCQLANQGGINAGELIHLFADALEVIVVARILPGWFSIIYGFQPAFPVAGVSPGLIQQCVLLCPTGVEQVL
ncbi:hypothetical protein D3C86_1829350 [compost metagenome]